MRISCFEFRQHVGADPASREPAVLEHRLACRSCAAHQDELQAFDRQLGGALALPVPETLAQRVLFAASRRPAPRRGWLASAAAAVLVLGLAAGWWWQSQFAAPLPQALVGHLMHEPALLTLPADQRADLAQVREVLDWGDTRLAAAPGEVQHAGLCLFRGRLVPHLVVPGPDGPVTVMLLPHVPVDRPRKFREQGFAGVLLPKGQGSVAVLSRSAQSSAVVAARYAELVDWRG